MDNVSVEVKNLFKYISWLFILVGSVFLLYGGFQLYDSYVNEGKRLDEAKSIISEDIVTADTKVDFDNIYDDISQGETVGLLYIPRLDREIPIIEGTDEEEGRMKRQAMKSLLLLPQALSNVRSGRI